MSAAGAPDPPAGLDDIAWDDLDLPGVDRTLRRLADPANDDDPADLFHYVISYSHPLTHAAAAALPFLVALLADPTTPRGEDIAGLLWLAADIARYERPPGQEPSSGDEACLAQLRALRSDLESLLDHPNTRVRVDIIDMLAAVGVGTDALIARYGNEPEEGPRGHILLAVAQLVRDGNAGPAAADWLAALDQPASQINLNVLLAWLRSGVRPVRVSDILAVMDDPHYRPRWYRLPGDEYRTAVELATIELDVNRSIEFCREVLHRFPRIPDEQPLRAAGQTMVRWRSATRELAPEIADALRRADPSGRVPLAHLLASTGPASQPYLDDLARAAEDADAELAARGVWALAMAGDERAIAPLNATIRESNMMWFQGGPPDFFDLKYPPSLSDLLPPMKPHADALMGSIRSRLATAANPGTVYQLCRILVHYGASSVEALPELQELLYTRYAWLACTVIGTIGPAADAASRPLSRLAKDRPFRPMASWAYAKVSGDAGPIRSGSHLPPDTEALDWFLPRLAEVGQGATGWAPALVQLIETKPDLEVRPTLIDAAYAHLRVTGDPGLCQAVFDRTLVAIDHGHQTAGVRRAVELLPDLGTAATAQLPRLDAIIASETRFTGIHGSWRGIAEDDDLLRLAQQSRARITEVR
jgi:hypothetical protein